MSFDLPGEINPFEAPRAGIGEAALSGDLADHDAELVRREHIGHELNIKSLGHLNYLVAFLWGIFVVFAILMAAGVIEGPPNRGNNVDATIQKFTMVAGAIFYLVLAIINAGLGFGLTHLQGWARWMAVVCISLAILWVGGIAMFLYAVFGPGPGSAALVFGEGILGLAMTLLLRGKSGVVFSPDYREVVRKTPHVKYRTSPIVKVLLIAILAGAFISLALLFGGGFR